MSKNLDIKNILDEKYLSGLPYGFQKIETLIEICACQADKISSDMIQKLNSASALPQDYFNVRMDELKKILCNGSQAEQKTEPKSVDVQDKTSDEEYISIPEEKDFVVKNGILQDQIEILQSQIKNKDQELKELHEKEIIFNELSENNKRMIVENSQLKKSNEETAKKNEELLRTSSKLKKINSDLIEEIGQMKASFSYKKKEEFSHKGNFYFKKMNTGDFLLLLFQTDKYSEEQKIFISELIRKEIPNKIIWDNVSAAFSVLVMDKLIARACKQEDIEYQSITEG